MITQTWLRYTMYSTLSFLLCTHNLHSLYAQEKKPPTQQKNSTQQTVHSPGSQATIASNKSPEKKQFPRNRTRRKKTHRKTMSSMDFNELNAKKNTHKKEKNYDIALKYIEQMLKLTSDENIRSELMLEHADLAFDAGSLQSAELTYREFVHYFPGHKKVEYASYRAILCAFYATLSFDRDQTKTNDTIVMADQFLSRSDIFTNYKGDVEKIRQKCYQKLVDSEINITMFYAKRGNFTQAENRLKNVRIDLLPQIPSFETRLVLLETEIEEMKKKPTGFASIVSDAKESIASVFSRFGTSKQENNTQLAANTKKKKMRDRF